MKLKKFIIISGTALVVIGTVGLLLNEFAWVHSSSRAIMFAVANIVGLTNLAFGHFGIKD